MYIMSRGVNNQAAKSPHRPTPPSGSATLSASWRRSSSTRVEGASVARLSGAQLLQQLVGDHVRGFRRLLALTYRGFAADAYFKHYRN
jgi:hypothetical protein